MRGDKPADRPERGYGCEPCGQFHGDRRALPATDRLSGAHRGACHPIVAFRTLDTGERDAGVGSVVRCRLCELGRRTFGFLDRDLDINPNARV